MRRININGVAISGEDFAIRKSGYSAEITVDGRVLNRNFRYESDVDGWIRKFVKAYPFVRMI